MSNRGPAGEMHAPIHGTNARLFTGVVPPCAEIETLSPEASALTVMLIVSLFAFVAWIALTAIVLLMCRPSVTDATAREAGAAQPR
jgi:hypothetical protein